MREVRDRMEDSSDWGTKERLDSVEDTWEPWLQTTLGAYDARDMQPGDIEHIRQKIDTFVGHNELLTEPAHYEKRCQALRSRLNAEFDRWLCL